MLLRRRGKNGEEWVSTAAPLNLALALVKELADPGYGQYLDILLEEAGQSPAPEATMLTYHKGRMQQ